MAEKKINLDDRKYDALKRVLAAQGRDINEEIVAQIEALYEDLVPEREQEQIAQASISAYPLGSLAVYSFKDHGEILYFITSNVMTLFESAKVYRQLEANGDRRLTLDTIMHEYFGEDGTEIINENLFSVLAKAMANDERITAVVEYNFDSDCVKVHDRDGVTVKHYTIETLMDTLECAEVALVRTDEERGEAMERFMKGREYLTEPLPPVGYLEAKLIICEAALNTLETCLNHVDCKYFDPLSNSLHDTRNGLRSVVDKTVMENVEALEPYLKEHFVKYTDQLWANGHLEYYGWDRSSLAKNIICAIDRTVSPNNGIGTLLWDEFEAQEKIGEIVATGDGLQITSDLAQAPESATSEERLLTVFSLMRCGLEDVHLVHNDEEHELATIVELNQDTLTEQGKQDWADVLGAKVERIYEGGYGVQIAVSGCDPQRLSDFSFMLAGYVSEKDFSKWVNDSPEQGENDAVQRL